MKNVVEHNAYSFLFDVVVVIHFVYDAYRAAFKGEGLRVHPPPKLWRKNIWSVLQSDFSTYKFSGRSMYISLCKRLIKNAIKIVVVRCLILCSEFVKNRLSAGLTRTRITVSRRCTIQIYFFTYLPTLLTALPQSL